MSFFTEMRVPSVLLAVACCLASSASSPAETVDDESSRADLVADFLGQYCMACHDAGSAEGDREFDSLTFPLTTESHLITADEIVDQVTLKQMPPEDSEQPSDEERVMLVEAVRESIAAARDQFKSSGGRTVLRRLSHREYENTLAVLFGNRVDTLGLTADFPRENTSEHLDNVGEALVTSGFSAGSILSGGRSIGRGTPEQTGNGTAELAFCRQLQAV